MLCNIERSNLQNQWTKQFLVHTRSDNPFLLEVYCWILDQEDGIELVFHLIFFLRNQFFLAKLVQWERNQLIRFLVADKECFRTMFVARLCAQICTVDVQKEPHCWYLKAHSIRLSTLLLFGLRQTIIHFIAWLVMQVTSDDLLTISLQVDTFSFQLLSPWYYFFVLPDLTWMTSRGKWKLCYPYRQNEIYLEMQKVCALQFYWVIVRTSAEEMLRVIEEYITPYVHARSSSWQSPAILASYRCC